MVQKFKKFFRLLAEDDEDIFGDFEDLESGEKVDAEEGESESDDDNENMDLDENKDGEKVDEKTKKQLVWEKKMKLKAAFNQEYDDKVIIC